MRVVEDAAVPRPRRVTGQIAQMVPTSMASPWVLVALLVGGGGGAGAYGVLGRPAPAPEIVALTARVDGLVSEDKDHGIRVSAMESTVQGVDTRVGKLEAADKALELRMLRWQVKTERWIVDVLGKQNTALGAIASKLGVKVDVRTPPLPEDVLESGSP